MVVGTMVVEIVVIGVVIAYPFAPFKKLEGSLQKQYLYW